MKTSTTADRLAEYMKLNKLRQVDVLEMLKPHCEELGVKIGKSEISQYLSGKFEPGSEKIYALSVALGVNTLWLMGYDEPMHVEEKPIPEDELDNELINLLSDLTPQETVRVIDFVAGLKAARAGEASPHK